MSELLTIIVPVYNEAGTVRQVIDRLLQIPLPLPREIIVINDGSTDGTTQVLNAVPKVDGVLSIVHAPANGGKGSAIRIGLSHASGTIIAIQDADLELDPVQLADLVQPILNGEAEVVYGSRFLNGRPPGPWLSVAANRTLTGLTNVLFGGRLTDMETCYKIMQTSVARSLHLESNRFDIEPEITAKLLRQRRRIFELPVTFDPRNRASGKKIGLRDGFRAIAVLIKYRLQSPPDLLASCSLLLAVLAAIGLAGVGVLRGTYAAGGSDSSCYALMAEAFASGDLMPTSALVSQVPWPSAPKTFTPGGFVPSQTHPSASAPVCAPGFSVLLAPVVAVGGRDALFWVTPLAAALLVWMTFVAGRALAGPLAGAMAAVLVAASPPVLYQAVQPMNDITTAALWMATFVALIQRRWTLAGLCCGLALLVRPNLLPLGIVAGLFVMRDSGLGIRSLKFAAGVLPFALVVLWLNNELYGSPLRTGYGSPGRLFGFSVLSTNASRYIGWLIETHTPFPLLAFASPFVVAHEKRKDVGLGLGVILVTCFIYFLYTPFDHWSYLRFLLPAVTLMLVFASAAMVRVLESLLGPAKAGHHLRASHYVLIGAVTGVLAMLYVRTAAERHAFALQFLEQRYRSAGIFVRDRLPEGAVVLSVWDSGAVRFHGRKEALTWEGLDPSWLDRSLGWLEQRGRRPYILVETWEEPGFRGRFGSHSDIGKLDWPPSYEIDRVVRIYDPQERARYHRGEPVDTEFVWPLRR